MLRMNSVRKKRTDKTVVKEHIVLAAAKSFAQKGVKTVRMDDIAAGLSISKRTLYELFHDKEDLLLDVMKLHREARPGRRRPRPPRIFPCGDTGSAVRRRIKSSCPVGAGHARPSACRLHPLNGSHCREGS